MSNSVKLLNFVDLNGDFLKFYTELNSDYKIGDKVFIHGGNYDNTKYTKPEHSEYNPHNPFAAGYTVLDIDNTDNSNSITLNIPITIGNESFTSGGITSLIIDPPPVYLEITSVNDIKEAYISRSVFLRGEFNGGEFREGLFGEFKIAEGTDSENPVVHNNSKFNNKFINNPAKFTQGIFMGGDWQWGEWTSKYNSDKFGKFQELNQYGTLKDPNDGSRVNIRTFANNFNGAGYNIMISGNIGRCYLDEHFLNITNQKIQFLSLPFELKKAYDYGFKIQLKIKNKYITVGKNDRIFNVESITNNNVFIKEINSELADITSKITQRLFKEIGFFNVEILISDSDLKPNSFETGRFLTPDVLSGDFTNMKMLGGVFWNGIFNSGQAVSDYTPLTWKGGIFDSTPVSGIATDVLWEDGVWINGTWEGAANFRILNIYKNNEKANIELDHKFLKHFSIGDEIMVSYIKRVIGNTYLQSYSDEIGEKFLNMNVFKVEEIIYTDELKEKLRFAIVIDAEVPTDPLNLQHARVSKSNFKKGVWENGDWQTGYKKGELINFTDIISGTRNELVLKVESVSQFKYWDWVEVANINIVRQITITNIIENQLADTRTINVKTNINTKLRIIDINKYDLTITLDTSFIEDITTADVFIGFELINERSLNVIGTSIWENGNFNSGLIENNIWKGGNFNSVLSDDLTSEDVQAIWRSGYWKTGTWVNGVYLSGVWLNGVWLDGTMTNSFGSQDQNTDNTFALGDSVWYNGTWTNGLWKRGLWKKGVFEGGQIENGGFDSIDLRGGAYLNGLGVFNDKSNGGILNNRSRNNATNQSVSAPSVIYVDRNGWIQLDQPSFYQNDYNIIFQDFNLIDDNVFNNEQFNIINRDKWGTKLKIFHGRDNTLDNPNPIDADQLPLIVINNSVDILEIASGIFWIADRNNQRVIEYNTNTDDLDVIGMVLNNPEKEIFDFKRISKMVSSENSGWVYFIDDYDVLVNNVNVTEYRWIRVSKDKGQFEVLKTTKNADVINAINNNTTTVNTGQTEVLTYKDIWVADDFNNTVISEACFLLTNTDVLYYRDNESFALSVNNTIEAFPFEIADIEQYTYLTGVRVKNTEKTDLFLFKGNTIYQVELNFQNNLFVINSTPDLIYSDEDSDIKYPISIITVDDSATTTYNTFYFIVDKEDGLGNTAQRIKRVLISLIDNTLSTRILNEENALSYHVNNIRLGFQNTRILYNAASNDYPQDSTVLGFSNFNSGIVGFNNPNKKLRLLDLVNSKGNTYEYWISDGKGTGDSANFGRLIKVDETIHSLYQNYIPVANFTPLKMVFGATTDTIYFISINDEGSQYQLQTVDKISPQPTEIVSITGEKMIDLTHVLVGSDSHVYYSTDTKLLSEGTPFTLTHNVSYRIITGVYRSGLTYIYGVKDNTITEIQITSSGVVTTSVVAIIPGITDLTASVVNNNVFLYILFNDSTVYKLESEFIGSQNVWSKFINTEKNELYITPNAEFGTNGGELYTSNNRVVLGGTEEDDIFYSVTPDNIANNSQSVNLAMTNDGSIYHFDIITNTIYQDNIAVKGRYKQFGSTSGNNILNQVKAIVNCGNKEFVLDGETIKEIGTTNKRVIPNAKDITSDGISLYVLTSNNIVEVDTLLSFTIPLGANILTSDNKITAVKENGNILFVVSNDTRIKIIDKDAPSVSYTLHTGYIKDVELITNSSTSGVSLYFNDNSDNLFVSNNLSASTSGWSNFIPVEIGVTKPIVNLNSEDAKLTILNNINKLYSHKEDDLKFSNADLFAIANYTSDTSYLVYYTIGASLFRLESSAGTNGNPILDKTLITNGLTNVNKIAAFKDRALILSNGVINVRSKTENYNLITPEVISSTNISLASDYSATPVDIGVNGDNVMVLYTINGSAGYSNATPGTNYSFVYGFNSASGIQGSYTGNYYHFISDPFGGVILDPIYSGTLQFNSNQVPYVVEIKDGATTLAKSLVNSLTTDINYTLDTLKAKLSLSGTYDVQRINQLLKLIRRTGSVSALTATAITGVFDTSNVSVSGGANGAIQILDSTTGAYDVFDIQIGGTTVTATPTYLNGTAGALNKIQFNSGNEVQISGNTITFTESTEEGVVTLVKRSDFLPQNGTSSFAGGTNPTITISIADIYSTSVVGSSTSVIINQSTSFSTSAFSQSQATIGGLNVGTYGGWVLLVLGEESKTVLVKSVSDLINSPFTNYELSQSGANLIAKTKITSDHVAANGKPFTVSRLEQVTPGTSSDASKASGSIDMTSADGVVFNLQLADQTVAGYVINNLINFNGSFTKYSNIISGNTISVQSNKSGVKFNTTNLSVISNWGSINIPSVSGMVLDKVNYQAKAYKMAVETGLIYLADVTNNINQHNINHSTHIIDNTVNNNFIVSSIKDMLANNSTAIVRETVSNPAISTTDDGKFYVNLPDGIQKASPTLTGINLLNGVISKIKIPATHTQATVQNITVGNAVSNGLIKHTLVNLDQYTLKRTFDIDVLVQGYKLKLNSSLDSNNSPYITGRVLYNLNLTGDVDFNVGGTPYTAHLVSSIWDPFVTEDNNGLFIGSWDTPKYVDYNYNIKESRFLNGVFQGEWYDGIFQGGLFTNNTDGSASRFYEGLIISDNNNITFNSGIIEPTSRRNDVTYAELDLDTNNLILGITSLEKNLITGEYIERNSLLEKSNLIRIPGLFKDEKILIHEVRKVKFNPDGQEELMLVCDTPEWLDDTFNTTTLYENQNIFISGLISEQIPSENTYKNRLYIELFGEHKVTNTFTINNNLCITIQCENSLEEPIFVFDDSSKPFIWMNQFFRIKDRKILSDNKSNIELLLEYNSPKFTTNQEKMDWIKGSLIVDAIHVESSGTSGESVYFSGSDNKAIIYSPQHIQAFKSSFVQTNYPISVVTDSTLRNLAFKDVIGTGVVMSRASTAGEDIVVENSDITSENNYLLRGALNPSNTTLSGKLVNTIFLSGETDLEFINGAWLNLDRYGFSNGSSKFKSVVYNKFVSSTLTYVETPVRNNFFGTTHLLLNNRVSSVGNILTLTIPALTDLKWTKHQYISLRGFSGVNSYLLGSGKSKVFRIEEYSYNNTSKIATIKIKIPKSVNVVVNEDKLQLQPSQILFTTEQDITTIKQLTADTSGGVNTFRLSAAYMSNNAWNGGEFDGQTFYGIWNGGTFKNGNFGVNGQLKAQWFSNPESYYWGGSIEVLKNTNEKDYTIILDLTDKPFEPGDLVYVRFNDYLNTDSFYTKVGLDLKVYGKTLNNFEEGEYGVNIIRYKKNNNLFLNQNLTLGPENSTSLHDLASNSFGTNGGWSEAETFYVIPGTEEEVWDIDSVSRDSIFQNGTLFTDIFRSGIMKGGKTSTSLIWKYGINEGGYIRNKTLWFGGFNSGGSHDFTQWLRGRWSDGRWESGNWYSLDQNLKYDITYSKWTGGIWFSKNTKAYLADSEKYTDALAINNFQLATEYSVWHGGIWESPVVNDANGIPKTYTWDSDFTEQFLIQSGNSTTKLESILLPRVSSLWLGGQWLRGEYRGGIFYGGIWHSKSLIDKQQYRYLDVVSQFSNNDMYVPTFGTETISLYILKNSTIIFSGAILSSSLPAGSKTMVRATSTILKGAVDILKTNGYTSNYSNDIDINGIATNGKLILENINTSDIWRFVLTSTYNGVVNKEMPKVEVNAYDVNASKFKGGKFINSVWLGGTVEDVVDPNETIFGDSLGDNVRTVVDDSGFNNQELSFRESLITKSQKYSGISLFNNQTNINTIWKSLKSVPLNSTYSAVWTRGIWKNGIFKHSSWYNLTTDFFAEKPVSKFNYASVFEKGLFFGSTWDGGLWVANNGRFIQNGVILSDNIVSSFSQSRWKKGYWTTDTNTTIVSNAGDDTELTNAKFWRSVWDCGVFEGGEFDLSVWRSGYVNNDVPTIKIGSSGTTGTSGTSGFDQNFLPYQRAKLTIEYDLDNIYGTSGTNGATGLSQTRSYDVLSVMENLRITSNNVIQSDFYNPALAYNWVFNVTDKTGTKNVAQAATININNQKFDGTTGTSGIALMNLTTQDLSLLNKYRFTGEVDNFASVWVNGIMRGSVWHGGVWFRGMFLHKESKGKDFFGQPTATDLGQTNNEYQQNNLGYWFRGIWLGGYFGYYNDTKVQEATDWVDYLNTYNNPRNRSIMMSMKPFTITSDMDPGSISGYRPSITLINIYNDKPIHSIFTRANKKLTTGKAFHSVFNGHMLGGSILDSDIPSKKVLLSAFSIIGDVYATGSSTSGNDPNTLLNFKLRNATVSDVSTKLPLPLDLSKVSDNYMYLNTNNSIVLYDTINYGNSFNYTFRHNNNKFGDGTPNSELPSLAQGGLDHFHINEPIGEPFHSTSGTFDYSTAITIASVEYIQNVANNDLILLIELNNYDLTSGNVNKVTITPNPLTGTGSLNINAGSDPNGLIQETSFIYNSSDIITDDETMFVVKVNKPSSSNLVIGSSYYIAIELS